MRSAFVWMRLAVVTALCAAACFACQRSPAPRISVADVERCERGMQAAALQPSLEQAMPIYYRECSHVYAEAACRKAFVDAAVAPKEPRLLVAFGPCARAYCPLLEDEELQACEPDFKAAPESLWVAWPPMHKAILKHDAAGYAPRIERAMLEFQFRTKGLPTVTPPPEAASAAASAAPSAAPSALAAPSASAGR